MPTTDWIFIGIFLIVAPLFPAIALLIPKFIAPRKPNPVKMQTYECGIETVGETWVQFKAQYYIFALVFLKVNLKVIEQFQGNSFAIFLHCF